MGYSDPERQREYQRMSVAKRRAAYFADKVCARCGSTDRLQLHHVYKATKVGHAIWSWGKAKREQELAKCVVVCHDCHQAEHREERSERMAAMNRARAAA